jgi:hypothetical protein
MDKKKANVALATKELLELPTDFYGTLEFRFHNGSIALASTTKSKKFNEYLERTTRKEDNNETTKDARL